MKFRTILCALTALFAASCGLSEIGEGTDDGYGQGGIWGGPLQDSQTGKLDQICYMTVVDYQKDYDWRADQAKEIVKCSLVVYADGRPLMKVPVGEAYQISADPDMHRIIDGHLYTDYSTDSLTIIKKDGILLHTYPGRELICGMHLLEDGLYSLGQNRDGTGFTFRRNAEVLVSRKTGTVMGTLRNVEGSLAFAFYDTIHSSEGDICRYYIVTDGKVSQVAVRDDLKVVWDILACGSEPLYLASLTGVAAPVLFSGDRMMTLPLPSNAILLSASLFYESDMICAEILYSVGRDIYTYIWSGGSIVCTFPKGMTAAAVYPLDRGVCSVANPLSAEGSAIIYRSGDQYSAPQGYACLGSDAVSMVNGILHVGLSSTEGDRPLLWKDAQTDTLNVNGYISSVTAF